MVNSTARVGTAAVALLTMGIGASILSDDVPVSGIDAERSVYPEPIREDDFVLSDMRLPSASAHSRHALDLGVTGQPEISSDPVWITVTLPNGTTGTGLMNSEGIGVGSWEYRNGDGTLQQRGAYDDEGRPIGKWEFFGEQGNVDFESFYDPTAGKVVDLLFDANGNVIEESEKAYSPAREGYYPEGLLRTWHDAGQRIQRAEGLYADRQMEGHWRFWHANGAIANEGEYQGGNRAGYWKFYDDHGGLTAESGVYDYETTQFPDGSPCTEGALLDGARHGYWAIYEPNGTLSEESGHYFRGAKTGDR